MPAPRPNPSIRRAKLEDAAAISGLNAHVQAVHADALPFRFKPPGAVSFAPADAAALIAKPDNIFFVAERDAIAIGYIYAEVQRRPETPFTYAYEHIYIHHISVHPDFRERGAGEALMGAVRGIAAELKIDTLTLDVWSFNTKARAFFRRQGFDIYNERLWTRPV